LRYSIFFIGLLLAFQALPVYAKNPQKTDVIIVGAGLSGLATAHELKKAGITYQILEIEPRIGGRVRTVHYHLPGSPILTADSGMEEYWESNPAVPILKELKLPISMDIAASSIVLDGKLEKLGNEDTEAFLKRIFNASDFHALEAFKAKAAPMIQQIFTLHQEGKPLPAQLMKLKDVPFSSWVKEQGVPLRVAEWIRISVECEIGTDWSRLSALDGLSEFHIFLGKGEQSYRVIGGNEKFTDALAKSVGQENIFVNEQVNRIVTTDQGVNVAYRNLTTNKVDIVQGKYVVSTIPLYRLFEIQFEPALSSKKRDGISSQSWGSYYKAHVFVKAGASKYWQTNGVSYLPILSDSDLGVIYEGDPGQKGPLKILSLLITGDTAEAYNMLNVDLIREKIKASLEKLWPGIGKEITAMELYRIHPRAIAGWPVGRSRYDELSDEIRKPENHVYLSGDFTESTHSSGAFESAHRVAQDIIKNIGPRRGN
jgi:monoamine oxidase